jgi:poly(A) polymerase
MKPASLATLKEHRILTAVHQFAQKRRKKLYVTGGILRDLFLNRSKDNPDIDFCLKNGAINFGHQLARHIHAGFVILDKEHGACRLVKKIKDKTYTLDFTDFRGKDLDEDLLHRDFTINAMSLELGKIFQGDSFSNLLHDPYAGRDDIKARVIRITSKKVFDEDALRVLRAFSLAATFDFKIDRETQKLIKLKGKKLTQVSFERIRDELFKILDTPNTFVWLQEMDRLRILTAIMPEIEEMRNLEQGPYHHLDVWRHTLETLRQLEILMQHLKYNKNIRDYLNEVISSERKRRALIKLAALLHDIGKPRALRHEDGKTKFHGHERIGLDITQVLAKRLKLSNDELDSLGKMVIWHLRPGYLADNEEVTERATFRYFRDTAQEGVSILLLSMADQRATRGPLTSRASRIRHEKVVLDLIKQYFIKKKEKKPPPIINGNDLIKRFRLQPSPLIGKILREIEELQAIGKIRTRKKAFQVARGFI